MADDAARTTPKGTRAWRRARIIELATDGATAPAIVAQVGLGERHVRRLLASPAIRAQIRAAEDDRLRRIGRRAASLADHMLTALVTIAADKQMPPAARVSAASKVIEIVLHEAEVALIRDRLDGLEATLRRLGAGTGDRPTTMTPIERGSTWAHRAT